MKTLIPLLACALAVAAPDPMSTWAADPPPSRTRGHVLLLENERTVEGDIELDGTQYRVRRQVGETWVPAGNVLCLCENLEEAYQFLRQRANLRDPDECIRLSRWCQLHGLRPQALAEAKTAVEMRPQSAEAQRLVQNLQKAATPPGAASPTPALPAPATASVPAASRAIEINAEAMGQFVSRVQPVLMNACASCHVSGQAGSFKLVRALEGGMVNRSATQQNLQAVLAQINRDHWEASALLTRAVTVHGKTGQPPLKSRQAPPYRNLEDWVRGTIAKNPSLQDQAASSLVAAAPLAEPKKLPEIVTANAEPLAGAIVSSSRPAAAPEAATAAIAPASADQAAAAPSAPPKPVAPVDPFDPVIFNQQMHPQGRK